MSNIANLRSWTNGLDLDLEEKNLFERWILNASDVNLFLPFYILILTFRLIHKFSPFTPGADPGRYGPALFIVYLIPFRG